MLRPRSTQLFCGPGFVINCWPATYIIDFPKRKPTSNLMARNKCTAAREEQKTLVLSIVSHTAVSLATHVGDFSFLRNAFFFLGTFYISRPVGSFLFFSCRWGIITLTVCMIRQYSNKIKCSVISGS